MARTRAMRAQDARNGVPATPEKQLETVVARKKRAIKKPSPPRPPPSILPKIIKRAQPFSPGYDSAGNLLLTPPPAPPAAVSTQQEDVIKESMDTTTDLSDESEDDNQEGATPTRSWGLGSIIPAARAAASFLQSPFKVSKTPSTPTPTRQIARSAATEPRRHVSATQGQSARTSRHSPPSPNRRNSVQSGTLLTKKQSEARQKSKTHRKELEAEITRLKEIQVEQEELLSKYRAKEYGTARGGIETDEFNLMKGDYKKMAIEEAKRLEAKRLEAQRAALRKIVEAERQEAERKEAERKEAARKEAERKKAQIEEAKRQEAELIKAQRQAKRKEAESKRAKRRERKRKRSPSPDVIPRNNNGCSGSFGIDLKWLCYDSTDEEIDEEDDEDDLDSPPSSKRGRYSDAEDSNVFDSVTTPTPAGEKPFVQPNSFSVPEPESDDSDYEYSQSYEGTPAPAIQSKPAAVDKPALSPTSELALKRQRELATKYASKTPSRLQQSSRLSTSTVASEGSEAVTPKPTDPASAAEPSTSAYADYAAGMSARSKAWLEYTWDKENAIDEAVDTFEFELLQFETAHDNPKFTTKVLDFVDEAWTASDDDAAVSLFSAELAGFTAAASA